MGELNSLWEYFWFKYEVTRSFSATVEFHFYT